MHTSIQKMTLQIVEKLLQFYNNLILPAFNIMMNQSSFSKKAMEYHKQIARKQRQAIFAKKRQQLIKQENQYPLNSSCLQKYWNISARQLKTYYDNIFDTLDDLNSEELSQEQTIELCADLMYLLTKDQQFIIPHTFKFRKDGSQYTAATVVYCVDCIQEEELNYWLSYMSEQLKELLYFKVQVQEQQDDYLRWINNKQFRTQLINDWGYIDEAQNALFMLICSADWGNQGQFFEQIFDRLFQMNKNKKIKYTPTFMRIIGQLMKYYFQFMQKKKYSFCRIIFNQSILNIHENNNFFDFGDQFIRLIDYLMEIGRQYATIIFSQQGFNAIFELLMNYYQHKFIDAQNQENQTKSIRFMNEKTQFMPDMLNICLNFMRVNQAHKSHFVIKEQYLMRIQPSKDSYMYDKFLKIVEYSRRAQQKNPYKEYKNNNYNNYSKNPNYQGYQQNNEQNTQQNNKQHYQQNNYQNNVNSQIVFEI